MECLTIEMIVLQPVARFLVLLPPLHGLWVSEVEADDDDGVELVSETQKIKKDPTKIT